MSVIKIWGLFFSVILATESCKKIDFPSPDAKNIVGEWNWIYAKGGITGSQIINAEDHEDSYQLQFTNKGRYKYLINNKTEERGGYSVELNFDSRRDYVSLLLVDKSKSALGG